MASLTSTCPTILTRVSSSSSSQSSFLHSKTHLRLNPSLISFSPFKTNRISLRIRGDLRVKATTEEKTYQTLQQPQLDNTGGDGGIGGSGGNGGGGGGGDGGEEEEEFEGDKKKMAAGMSMSQKLTLGYAALVGVGGLMGYLKSGSQKSLMAGGLSALLLFYVYTQLPTNPIFASSIGFGLSGALLGVMGSRFKKSGKVFPAVGGLMGYLKSGSQKSLAAGGLSALLLFYVYTQLPTNPIFASSIGFGLSGALLGVIGSRFKKSGKVFPAGVVSVVSLVMTAGYLHGIVRSVLHG